MSKLSPQFIKPNVIKHHKDLVNSFSSLPLDTDGFLDDGDTGQKDPDKFFWRCLYFFCKDGQVFTFWQGIYKMFGIYWFWKEKWDNIRLQTIFQDFIKIYKVAAEDSSILNSVEEQFIDYLAFSRYHISENIGESAKTSDNDYQMDLIWATIFPNNPFPILPILC